MANLYGTAYTRRELMKYVGDISQIADARESRITTGKADGVRAIDVKTGSGLEFTVLPSRAMDIAWASYKGRPVSFLSKSSVVKPEMFEKDGLSFLRNFHCGLVTTCGLTYMGAPCEDEGAALGLHGRISNIPASDVSVWKEWEGDEYVMRIRGKTAESAIFGENLTITRQITAKLGDKKLSIHDRVENLGYDPQPLMVLYHINFGFPVVSEHSRLLQSWKPAVTPRDQEAQKGLDRYGSFEAPTHGCQEQVFFHDVPRGGAEAYACVFNDRMGYGAYVKFSLEDFTHFGQWKLMGEGDYVVGLEPGTWFPLGRAEARRRGELRLIEPGETADFRYEIGVVESAQEVDAIL